MRSSRKVDGIFRHIAVDILNDPPTLPPHPEPEETMSARARTGKQGGQRGQSRPNGVMPASNESSVDDAGTGQGHRALRSDARCLPFIAGRLESAADYARFAATAGVDILMSGEPLDGFKVVRNLDETHLRTKAIELQREVFNEHLRQSNAPTNRKAIRG